MMLLAVAQNDVTWLLVPVMHAYCLQPQQDGSVLYSMAWGHML